jgi:hypothetical protein
MLFLPKLTALLTSVVLSAGLLIAGFSLASTGHSVIPTAQDPGQQTALFTGATITTTTQAATVACPQGAGSIGRKTLAVHNAGAGAVTVTVELRDYQSGPNVTSGYLAVNGLATGLASTDVATPAEAGGAFCRVSAVSASTSTITVTLRRE